MAEFTQVSNFPESSRIVRAAEAYCEIALTPDEVKKAIQTGAYNLRRSNTKVKLLGKVSNIFFLKGLSFNKSKCGNLGYPHVFVLLRDGTGNQSDHQGLCSTSQPQQDYKDTQSFAAHKPKYSAARN